MSRRSASTRALCLALLGVPAAMGTTNPPQDAHSLLLNPDAPAFSAPAPERAVVRLETSRGIIDIEVTRGWAPRGADRFIALVTHGYYDDVRFFRVTPGRWVQFGINGDPAIARAWRTRTIPDDPFVQSNVRGTVAFAFAVPDGRTTQVFVNLRDNSETHDKEPFTPFGRVIAGMDVADALNAEYGEGPGGIRAGKQDAYFDGGHAWLLRQFPRLDYIRRATVRPQRQRQVSAPGATTPASTRIQGSAFQPHTRVTSWTSNSWPSLLACRKICPR